MPKGGGCENMSRFTIMLPSAGKQGITDFVLQTVEEAGGNPCPPIIVGLGVGGTAEYAMYLAKHALTRKVGDPNPDPEAAAFEAELLEKVNALGVGPQAVGGTTPPSPSTWRPTPRTSPPSRSPSTSSATPPA